MEQKQSLDWKRIRGFYYYIIVCTKWPPFSRKHFKIDILQWRYLKYDWKFTPGCSWGSQWQGSGNGLVLNRWQTITCRTNVDEGQWVKLLPLTLKNFFCKAGLFPVSLSSKQHKTSVCGPARSPKVLTNGSIDWKQRKKPEPAWS